MQQMIVAVKKGADAKQVDNLLTRAKKELRAILGEEGRQYL